VPFLSISAISKGLHHPLFFFGCMLQLLIIVSCMNSGPKPVSSEVVLFSTIGDIPFRDCICSVETDGSNFKRLLSPTQNRSYLYASGNSLRNGLVVTVEELDSSGQIEVHMYLYHPKDDQWIRLLTEEGLEGAGYMSPDSSRIAYVFAPKSQPKQLRTWVMDLKTGNRKKLTGDDNQEGAWDGYLSWRPDGKEIVFLRLNLTADGVTSKLMSVSPSGGQPNLILEKQEGTAASCYAPDGKRLAVLSKNGLEILEPTEPSRKVIVPLSSLPNVQLLMGSLICSRTQDVIAFSVFNRETKQYELWTVSSDGTGLSQIYSQGEKDGKLTVSSFIQE